MSIVVRNPHTDVYTYLGPTGNALNYTKHQVISTDFGPAEILDTFPVEKNDCLETWGDLNPWVYDFYYFRFSRMLLKFDEETYGFVDVFYNKDNSEQVLYGCRKYPKEIINHFIGRPVDIEDPFLV